MKNFENTLIHNENQPEKIQGCGTIALLVFSSIWVFGLSVLDLFLCWSVEQSLFENYLGMYDFRWIIHTIYCVLLFIPLILMFFLVKTPRLKLMFRLWMVAGGFTAICIPMKLLAVTAQQETALLQIGVSCIVLFGLKAIRKPDDKLNLKDLPKSQIFGLIAVIGACMSFPWIFFGSLGSWEDTLLFLISGTLFGITVSVLVFPLMLDLTENVDREIKFADFILDGLVIALFLLIMVTGFAQNGSQLMLGLTVPITGWLVAAISIACRGTSDRGKAGVAGITGLALALPLVWFDMDELFLLISSTPGEIMEYALKAAWYTFMFVMVIIIIVMINFQFVSKIRINSKVNWLFCGAMTAAMVAVYLLWGRVGFFGERLFVVLKPTADLSTVNQSQSIENKRTEVYDLLVQEADNSQQAIRSDLKKKGIRYTAYYLENGLEIQGGIFTRIWLDKRNDVDRIVESPVLRPLPKSPVLAEGTITKAPDQPVWNLQMIGVDKVWKDLGITGKGIVIGQTDSGVDGGHAELASSYRGANEGNDFNWLDPWNHSTSPEDLQGHGTETLGVMLGKNVGIAPDAQWMACVNLGRNLGNPAHYLDCMQFMLAPYPQGGDPFTQGDPSRGAMIINNSWGCPAVEGCDADMFANAAAALETAGIFVSSAAGNTGYYGCGSVTDPMAIYADVLTVGSVNQAGQLSAFSSLGPVLVDGSNRVKPEIVAPGEEITSSYPGDTYATVSGTSFSAPHVTGVVALMWSANPALIGNVEATKKILEQTASPVDTQIPECAKVESGPNNATGYGLLNAYEAVKAALDYK